jgi:predicted ATPase/DNA-binding SARP family transcriptional activator
MILEPWRVEMLGGLRAKQAGQTIARFQTYKTGAILGYLAYYLQRVHTREELIEIFWQESELNNGRHSLRQALASLRRVLEPSALTAGKILMADRANVWLNADAFQTDVMEFEAALKGAARSEDLSERGAHLQKAVDLYGGELLCNYHEDWIVYERQRLSGDYITALRELALLRGKTGSLRAALDCALRAVAADPLQEDSHYIVIRLYAAVGQVSAAQRQYSELERILQTELGDTPSARTRAFMQSLETARRTEPPAGKPVTPAAAVSLQEKPVSDQRPHARQETQKPAVGSVIPPPSLPVSLTRFFGRETEIAMLTDLLMPREGGAASGSRLVTLIGPGGSGKTRLSVEVASRCLEAFGGCVWFVPLAALKDADLIPGAALDVMKQRRKQEQEPFEHLAELLSNRRALLVLDNFEQLIPEQEEGGTSGALMIHRLLQRLPLLTCLITSRQLLGLGGECAFVVPPLPVPSADIPPAELREYASVRLFVDRAQAARPGFQLTANNAEAVCALCGKLEGIPLALELAAARSQMLTPAQMIEQLNHRFQFLVSRSRDVPERHRTLYRAIEWSYQLLPAGLQRFFTQLSVFHGGWTLETANAVCLLPEPSDPDLSPTFSLLQTHSALDCLQQLAERSLIVTDDSPEGVRYRLLDTIREYAEERLSDEDRQAVCLRHARFYCDLAERADARLRGSGQARWLDELDREHDNLRAAMAWSLRAGERRLALRLAAALAQFWEVRRHFDEGRRWLKETLRDYPELDILRARALYGLATLTCYQFDFEQAREMLLESLKLCRQADDPRATVHALKYLGFEEWHSGRAESSQRYFQEALTLSRRIGDAPGIEDSLIGLAKSAIYWGDYAQARAFLEEALQIARLEGDRSSIAIALLELGIATWFQEDIEAAEMFAVESYPLLEQLDDRFGVVRALWCLGNVARAREDYARARTLYMQFLEMVQAIGNQWGIAYGLEAFAKLALARHQAVRAARLLGASRALYDSIGDAPRIPADLADYRNLVASTRHALGEERFDRAWALGHAMTVEQACQEAMKIE